MTENTITITEVWEQIKKLQEQIATLKETTESCKGYINVVWAE